MGYTNSWRPHTRAQQPQSKQLAQHGTAHSSPNESIKLNVFKPCSVNELSKWCIRSRCNSWRNTSRWSAFRRSHCAVNMHFIGALPPLFALHVFSTLIDSLGKAGIQWRRGEIASILDQCTTSHPLPSRRCRLIYHQDEHSILIAQSTGARLREFARFLEVDQLSESTVPCG